MESQEDDAIAVKVRGPKNFEKECFFFLEEILGIIDQVGYNLYCCTLHFD